MIDLNILESEAQQREMQQAQQSPLMQKAVQSQVQQEQMSPEVHSIMKEIQAMQEREAVRNRIATYAYACGGNIHAGGGSIHIDPSKRGTFTAAASRHGMGVQAFASKVLANKDNYSPAMVKKANFARNASHWHAGGGSLDKARPLYDELIAANIPHNLAIGVIGNIIAESSANPEAKNSVNGGHFGYLQNDKNITNHIKKYYGGYGHDEQMQFLKDGLTGRIRGAAQAPWIQQRFDSYKQHMRGVTDPAQAALLWERDYEKSANEGLQKRADYARQFSSMLGNPSSAAADYSQYAGAGSFEPITMSPDAQSSFKPWWEQDYASAPVDDDLYAAAAGNPQLPELQDGLFGYGESDAGSYPNLFAGGGYIEDGLRALGVTGFRVTSGYRGPNSKVGNAGKSSGHARHLRDGSSGAIDIVPLDKSASGWAALENQLRQPQVQRFLASFGGTILDERDPATMKKTRATGPHFHIGLGVRDGGNFYGHGTAVPMGATYAGQAYDGSYYEPISVDPTDGSEDSFNPWWSSQQDNTDMDSLYTAAAGNLILPEPSAETLGTGTTYPAMFAEGGAYNDDFMKYYGYSWVPGSQIYLSDPYFKEIQKHNPNGLYAVDADGYYVPASTMKSNWDYYSKNVNNPSMNTPATAYPLHEVTYTLQDDDLNAIDAATRMFGDNRDLVYDDLWNRGSASATNILNKLDTLSSNSAYMTLNTDPEYIAKLKQKSYKVKPDGTLRAQYNANTNTATIEPVHGHFFEPYISEFVHGFQYNNSIPGINLIGYNPRAITKNRKAVDASYNDPESAEYKAHRILQPIMNNYLNNPSMGYNQFIAALKSNQRAALANR